MSFRLRNNGPIWLGEFTALTEAGFSNGCSCRLHGASSIVPDGFNLALHVGDEAELVNATAGSLRRRWVWMRQGLLPVPRCTAVRSFV